MAEQQHQPPIPHRTLHLADIVALLRYAGRLPSGAFGRHSFPVSDHVNIMWGLNSWNVIRLEVWSKPDRRFACNVHLYGIDGVSTGRQLSVTFSSLMLTERRAIYNAVCSYLSLPRYFT